MSDAGAVCQTSTAHTQGSTTGKESQHSVLDMQAMTETLKALTQQLASQSEEMREMREVVASLRLHQSKFAVDNSADGL